MPDTLVIDNTTFISDSPITAEMAQHYYFEVHPEEDPHRIEKEKERTEEIAAFIFFMIIAIILMNVFISVFKLEKINFFRIVFNPIHKYFGKLMNFLERSLPNVTPEEEAYYNGTNTLNSNQQLSYFVYNGNELTFSKIELHQILEKRHPYYNNLNSELQQKFIERLQNFIQHKIFIIHTPNGFKEMPILISASAIQLTFGLRDYLLPYFVYLQIKPTEYFANDESLRVLAGHVVANSITIAFNHMIDGYQDASDGQNVALHEMAHALYYQKLVIDLHKEYNFNTLFEKVLQEGEELYQTKNQNSLYTATAFINLQEFWAESVELFFEKPTQLYVYNKELYDVIANMLNQNSQMSTSPILN